MIAVTYLPLFISILFRGMPGVWHHRHRAQLLVRGQGQTKQGLKASVDPGKPEV
jgi:hypothetical protein